MTEIECLKPPPATRYNYLSLGAGVQSSCLALMLEHKEIETQVDGAVFADTQSEPAEVYEWLDELEKLVSFPIHRVTAGDLRKESLRVRKSKRTGINYLNVKIPFFVTKDVGRDSIMGRKCTGSFKIEPISQALRKLCNVKRGQKETTVTQMIGISWDEIQRMKELRRMPWAQARWPLLEKRMTRRDCKEWMKANGYPEPPRSACTFCPFHNDGEWRRLKTEHAKDFAEAVTFEKELQAANLKADPKGQVRGVPYLHSSCKPLEEVDLSTDQERGQIVWDFGSECEGVCGV